MYTPAIFLVFIIAAAAATSKPPYQRVNNTVKSSPSDKVTVKSARSDFHHHGYDSTHHYPHHFGHHLGGYGHHKEFEHYLLPMLVVLGMGVLFMPLLSLLMTSMIGNVPVTTLVSGRRKREAVAKPVEDQTIQKLWQKLGKAIEVFTKDNK